MFKIGEKVILNNKAKNKSLIGSELCFVGYMQDSCKIGNDDIDCIVSDISGTLFLSNSEKLDKTYNYNHPYDKTTVKVDKNITIVKLVINGKEYVGIAKCSPEDKFDFRVGFDVALARCEDQMLNEMALKISGKYPENAIPINTIVKIVAAGKTYPGGDNCNPYLDYAILKGTINRKFAKYYTSVSKDKYYKMAGSHSVDNVKFVVRGVSTLYNHYTYIIQEVDTKEHGITVIDEEGIKIDK